ncbi:MAG: hypothetical protein WBM48_14655, partial [Polyangiales bacterium]
MMVGTKSSSDVLVAAALVVAACNDGSSSPNAGTGGSGGEGGAPASRIMPGLGFVATSFGFYYPQSADAPLDGANLDAHLSSSASPRPQECAHDDFMGLNDEPGVDYNFLRIITDEETREDGKFVFGGFREGQLVDGVISGATKNGSMTILLQVQGLDDAQNDDEVMVQIFASEDSPALGTDNSVLTGATLSVHPESRFHSGEVRGKVEDGVLTAGPIDLLFPIDIMIVRDELRVHSSKLRLRLGDGSFEGTVTGYWDVANIRSIIGVPTTDNGDAANFTIEQFDAAMAELADWDVDEETGICKSISTIFQIRGTQAFLANDGGPSGAGGSGGRNGGGGGPMLLDQCLNPADEAALEALATEDQSGPAIVGGIAGDCPIEECGAEVGGVLSDSSEAARNALGDCIAACISSRTVLSTQCTSCYGTIAACSTAFCIEPCLPPNSGSEECASCALENCIDVNACTGFY